MWLPNCLPPTYPACSYTATEMFGIPPRTHGRCSGVPLRGVVIHCIETPVATYLNSHCTLPRHFRQIGRQHHDSLHWLINRDGHLIQMVCEEDVAWGWGDPDNGCLPNVTWPPIQGVPTDLLDCAVIHIGIEVPTKTAYWGGCDCDCERPTPYPNLNPTLTRLLAAIAQKYNWPLTTDYFQLDSNLNTCSEECECIRIENILCAAKNYCERPTLFTQEDYPEAPLTECVQWVLVITDTGRVARVKPDRIKGCGND